MERLFICYQQIVVGYLNRLSDGTLSFSYTEQWIKSPKSFPISPLLKLTSLEMTDQRIIKSFFDNLLPEGQTFGGTAESKMNMKKDFCHFKKEIFFRWCFSF